MVAAALPPNHFADIAMPPDNRQNYFELFGIKPSFCIDKQSLEVAYLKLQALLHPDRFATASEQERRIAAQKSAYLNEAYDVLTDACSRADYLLKLRGYTTDADASMSDDDFLIKQMEYRERLEDAAAEQSDEQAVALCDEIDRQRTKIDKDFEHAYDKNSFAVAQSLLARMRFMKKLKSEIKEIIAAKEHL